MKTKIIILIFALIGFSFTINSQTVPLSSECSYNEKIQFIKTIKGSYIEGKVYLHFDINKNTETKILVVERSLDGKSYEMIGQIKVYINNTKIDCAYYFTDESPIVTNLYYRFTDYFSSNKPIYSETIYVYPQIHGNNEVTEINTTKANTIKK